MQSYDLDRSTAKSSESDALSWDAILPDSWKSASHIPVDSSISNVYCIVTVGTDTRFLPHTIKAILSQSVVPQIVIIADTARVLSPFSHEFQTENGDYILLATVHISGAVSFGDAISRTITTIQSEQVIPAPTPTDFLWILHDDSRPASEDTLQRLLTTQKKTQLAGIIGAAQVDWEETPVEKKENLWSLQNVGYFVDKNWRRTSLVVEGEEDQGQYNSRQDVFAVSLAGALIPFQIWKQLKGTNSRYGTFGESLDFCRRLYACELRVVVEPRALIAHRRARFEGIRHLRSGVPLSKQHIPYKEIDLTEKIFSSTQFSSLRGLWEWLCSLFLSLWACIYCLFEKMPVEAWWKLWSPWEWMIHFPRILSLKGELKKYPRISLKTVQTLVATRDELRHWHHKQRATREGFEEPYNPLVSAHLKKIQRQKYAYLGFLIVMGICGTLAIYWHILSELFSGYSLYSAFISPTGAHLGETAFAATTFRSLSTVSLDSAAPAPIGLLFIILALCGGSLAIGITVLILVAPTLSLLSAWLAAGSITRSLPLRFATAFMWGALIMATGLMQSGNIPGLIIAIFLPLDFYVMARALGKYAVNPQVEAHSSVEAVAIAGLTWAVTCAAEPQLCILYLIVLIAYSLFMPQYRLRIWMTAIPTVVILLPTFVNSVWGWKIQTWRQLFGNILVPSTLMEGSAQASLVQKLIHFFSLWTIFPGNHGAQDILAIVGVSIVCILILCAIAALVFPSARYLTRWAWCFVLGGLLLFLIAPHVPIGLDASQIVTASVIPAILATGLGILLALCAISGSKNISSKLFLKIAALHHYSANVMAGRVVRGIVAGLVIVLAMGMYIGSGYSYVTRPSSLSATSSALPLVAQSDLDNSPNARILAISALSPTQISIWPMRTASGDIIEQNPSSQVASLSAISSSEEKLRKSAAQLMSSSNAQAISTISQEGFTGIFVPYRADPWENNLVAHILSSPRTIPIVHSEDGLYVRLASTSQDSPNTLSASSAPNSQSGQSSQKSLSFAQKIKQESADPWRWIWIVLLIIILLGYGITAFPTRQTFIVRRYRSSDSDSEKQEGATQKADTNESNRR